METGLGTFVTDAMNSEQSRLNPCFQRFNINKVICSAIKTDESVSGVIYIDSNNSECKWDNRHLAMLDLTGQFLGLSTQNILLLAAGNENKRLIAAGKATLQLSHSVKNILQMVGGAAEVIDFGLRANEIHRVKRSWDILKPNIERLKKFTLDMLDYSKERKLELEACDFNRVIQGSIESLQTQLKLKKTKLLIRVDQNMPTVELDSERIHEMSLNLILNAIDIVDETTGVVNIETRYIEEAREVELSITDNGPGMTEEIKKTIFTPFESGKNKFGTGLGMPIAKQVVDQHSGRIEIDTKIGKGSTFRVYLPAKVIEQN
jgi:signal transduction histidine kinase